MVSMRICSVLLIVLTVKIKFTAQMLKQCLLDYKHVTFGEESRVGQRIRRLEKLAAQTAIQT